MGTLKPVRFKLAWQTYRVGDVITPNGTLRDWLVVNGYVDILENNQSPVDRQLKVPSKRKQGGGPGLFNTR